MMIGNESLRRSSHSHLALMVAFAVIPFQTAAAEDPAVALRERYLDRSGRPSPAVYADAHEITPIPGSESFDWQVIFRFAFRAADVNRLEAAEPVYTDCYFNLHRRHDAAFRAETMWDGRVYQSNDKLVAAVFTPQRERVAGFVDELGHLRLEQAADSPLSSALLSNLQSGQYNPFTGQLWRRAAGGTIVEERQLYLPLPLVDSSGHSIQPEYRIARTEGSQFALIGSVGGEDIPLARCAIGAEDTARIQPGYAPVLAPGALMAVEEPMVILEVRGEILAESLDASNGRLALKKERTGAAMAPPIVNIDGRFDEWRSVAGIADPRGDVVWYLDVNPDTDLLEFKVASDEEHLYFYTRVAGRHGNTAGSRDRYYFYIYIDVDRNPATGYIPTRDDDCYFGVAIGDDCEAQFEFVDGRFVKNFFGFAGGSKEQDVLSGQVKLAPSWYSKHDEEGRLRDGYKVEYVRQGDEIKITEDFEEGTTDDIQIGLSPDGSECEMRARLSGFLRDANGNPLLAPSQSIDLAAGVEASGKIRGNDRWGADSTAVIRGYVIGK